MASKVQVRILRSSKGRKVRAGDLARDGDKISVWYAGRLTSNDQQFDKNYDFTTFTPLRNLFTFELGKQSVIQGWEIALGDGKRRVGEVLEIVIPAVLAYGNQSRPNIPANSDLTFIVEIVAVTPAGSAETLYPYFSDLGIPLVAVQEIIEFRDAFPQPQNPPTTQQIGTNQADNLTGTPAPNVLIGLKGDDILKGGGAADLLIGGPGANRYVYTAVSDSPVPDTAEAITRDRIVGFKGKGRQGDKIDLSAIDGDLQYIGSSSFAGQPGQVRFSAGVLQVDTDGDAVANMEILMPGVKSLAATSLLL
jgi:Ca2+-binding RTX toxin-like protein